MKRISGMTLIVTSLVVTIFSFSAYGSEQALESPAQVNSSPESERIENSDSTAEAPQQQVISFLSPLHADLLAPPLSMGNSCIPGSRCREPGQCGIDGVCVVIYRVCLCQF